MVQSVRMKHLQLCIIFSVLAYIACQKSVTKSPEGCPPSMTKKCKEVKGVCGWTSPGMDYQLYAMDFCRGKQNDMEITCGHCWTPRDDRRCTRNECCERFYRGRCSRTSPGPEWRAMYPCSLGDDCMCWVRKRDGFPEKQTKPLPDYCDDFPLKG